MESAALEVARAFFAHWRENRVEQALAMLSQNVLYDNVPYPDIVGRDNVRAFFRDAGMGSDFTLDWRVTHIAASGNVVLNERVDIFSHKNGGIITLPVMGTVEVEDGWITIWRDYFDPAAFDRQMAKIIAT